MNKLYRSLLLTGIVAAGLAGCGDDVTVVDPPPPPPAPLPQVRSVTVAPDNVIVAPGGSLQMSAAVTADAGCTPATAWSSSDVTRATVNATSGLVAVPAAATSGPVAIRATATCATGGSSGSGVATLNIQAATITGVTVNPPSAILPADPNARLTATATVQGTGAFNTGVDWSISNTGIVTLSCTTSCPASNNVDIIPVSGASGTVQVRATSKGDNTKSAVISVQVIPATVTIQSITTGNLNVPVNLAFVAGQIEISLNVDPGAAPNVAKVQAVIGSDVVAEQIFGSGPSAGAAPSAAPQTIVLSTNTMQVAKANGLFVPVVRNGNNSISARVFLTNNSTPIVSNAIPVRMTNVDAIFSPGNLKASNPSSQTVLGSGTWYTGGLQIDSVNFVAFDTLPPNGLGISVCGSTGTATTTGSWNTGMEVSVAYGCATSTGSQSVTGGPAAVTYASTAGPDGTTPVGPTAYSGVTSKYIVDGKDRWNLIPGTLASIAAVRVDNVAPAVTANEIGFLAGCTPTIPAPGCWINQPYNLAGDFPATDIGGTGVKTTEVFDVLTVTPLACGTTAYTAGLVEDPSPVKYDACAVVKDSVGNAGLARGANLFGFDNTAPVVLYAATATYTPDSQYVAVVPAQTLQFSFQDNNSGLDAALSGVLGASHTLADAAPACTIPSGALTGSGIAPQTLVTPFAPDGGCGDQGVYRWNVQGQDRAGNTNAAIKKAFGLDRTPPVVNAFAPQPLYGGGLAANFLLFATDSVDLASARVGIGYATPNVPAIEIGYTFTSGFGAQWDTILTQVTTPATGAALQVPGTQVLGGIVTSVGTDTTVAVGGAANGFTGLNATVTDFLPSTSAPFTTGVTPLPAVFKDATKFSTSATVWATPNLGAAAFATVGSTCVFNYNTPTNGPTIPARVLIVSETGAATNIFTVLKEITTTGNGLGASDNPKLISDNGIQRNYQYLVTGTQSCVAFLPGPAVLRLIAVKNDAATIPVGYLVP